MAKIYKADPPLKWTSITEKKGPEESDDCIVMTEDGEICRAYFNSKEEWMAYSCGCYDFKLDYVEYWMLMPKFD